MIDRYAYDPRLAYTFIGEGPVILVTTADGEENNVFALAWSIVLDYDPPKVGICTGSWNHSFAGLIKNGECVLNIPAADFLETGVALGNVSGRDVNKFEKYALGTALAEGVKPLILTDCPVNMECRLIDYVEKHDFLVLSVERIWVKNGFSRARDKFFHSMGDMRYVVNGEIADLEGRDGCPAFCTKDKRL